MAQSTPFGGSTGSFDAFLYAAIDEDQHGVALTVLSALARRNVDPWEEAARLGRLPAVEAVRELATLVAAIAPGPIPRGDAETIAARLQSLLPRSPRRAAPDGHAREEGVRRELPSSPRQRRPTRHDSSSQQIETQVKPRSVLSYFLFYLVFVVLLVCSQWLNPNIETKAGGASSTMQREAPVNSPASPP